MSDLITYEYAKAQLPNAKDADRAVIQSMITAASGVVETYCRRIFLKATYDELHTVTGWSQYLFVQNPPISRVYSVRSGQLPALYIQHPDPQTQIQEATVTVTDTAVILNRIYNNVITTHTLLFATYPTFEVLADAINALNDQWVAIKCPQFNKWQCADMIEQGSWSARAITISLLVYWWTMPYYKVNEELGEIQNPGNWVNGYQYLRVKYDGGFDEVPAQIQHATASLVQLMFASRAANPLMQSETLNQYSYTKSATQSLDNLDEASKLALNSFKLFRVAKYK